MNSARYNSDCNGEVDGMKVEMVLVLVMMVMMISMMPVTMVMTMRTISPSREEFSSAESSRRKGLPLSIGFHRGAAAKSRKLFCPQNF